MDRFSGVWGEDTCRLISTRNGEAQSVITMFAAIVCGGDAEGKESSTSMLSVSVLGIMLDLHLACSTTGYFLLVFLCYSCALAVLCLIVLNIKNKLDCEN